MTKCKYENENWNFKCPIEADEGDEYCYWHQNVEKKTPNRKQIEELRNRKIIGVYLKKVELSKYVLEDMRLDSGLVGISLIESNLEGADFSRATLVNANFTNSKIQGAYFDNATLTKIHFDYVELQDACFDNTDITEVDFSNADVRNASFLKTSIENSFFINSNMQGANFTGSEIKGSNLKNAKMQNAILVSANIQGVDFRDVQMQGAILDNSFFDSKSNFKNTNLIYASLHNSYIDESKTFKDAILFESKNIAEKEINECIGDTFKSRIFSFKSRLIIKFDFIEDSLKSNDGIQTLEYIQKNGLIKPFLVEDIPIKVIFYENLVAFVLEKKKIYANIKSILKKLIQSRKKTEIKIFIDEIKKEMSNEDFETVFSDLQRLNLIKSRESDSLVNDDEIIDVGSGVSLTSLLSEKKQSKYIVSSDLLNYVQSEEQFINNINENFDKLIFLKKSFITYIFEKVTFLEKLQFICILDKYLLVSVRKECVLNCKSLKYYNASYEVYNMLYKFYIKDSNLLNAKHAHYRRGEVYRKNLLAKGGIKSKLRAWIFDGFILKILTGHGDQIWNPIVSSAIGILLFAFSYLMINGINVQGREAKLLDYLYFSLTTFTGYGFSNIQPDITIPLMQPLVMAESVFGLMMVSLIIFVITYQISR